MIDIYILGQRYEVPEGLTILKSFEWAGFHLTRGVGCRGGFCGACGTVYRMEGDYHLRYALACQTVAQPGMILGQIPFFPAQRASYHLEQLTPEGETLLALYPEILRCFGCNTCTKACPQELQVLDYMSAALRGDMHARGPVLRLHYVRAVRGALPGGAGAAQRGTAGAPPVWKVPGAVCRASAPQGASYPGGRLPRGFG